MRQRNDIGGSSDVGLKGSGTRANALWGKGRRRYSLLLAIAVLAAAVTAGVTTSSSLAAAQDLSDAKVPKALWDKARSSPAETFRVVIQATGPGQTGAIGMEVEQARQKHPGKARGVKKAFSSLGAVSADLTGEQIGALAASGGVRAITEDTPLQAAAYGNPQAWVKTVAAQWASPPKGTVYPTIAIIDSGVQSRSDFGTRLVRQVDFTSGTTQNSGGDGYGHGTLVAGLAIGEKDGFTGTEPRGRVVSLDVLDDAGSGFVSDALAACDWILQNRIRDNIRIANFSVNASSAGLANDPLNRAVEKLWLNGVVVVAAAGNYAQDGAESGVVYSPANDPFVITVGAAGTRNTETSSDDAAAPWSAWGFTQDGFRKPELAAPGRAMNGPTPKDKFLYKTFAPTRKVGDGYIWMSGTSFAAPVVAGAAATLLSRNPSWTPDQVKGALMVSADVPAGYNSLGALGVGLVDVAGAMSASGLANPNAALNGFVVTEPSTGLRTFDAAAWAAAAASNPTWNAASWSSASWSSASWSSASWSSASWSSASWSSASWSSASWSSASWSSASWSSASWASMLAAE